MNGQDEHGATLSHRGSLCPRVSPVLDFAALALWMMCEGHERMLFWASGA